MATVVHMDHLKSGGHGPGLQETTVHTIAGHTPDSLPSASSLLLVLHQSVLQHSMLLGAGGMVHRQVNYLGGKVQSHSTPRKRLAAILTLT